MHVESNENNCSGSGTNLDAHSSTEIIHVVQIGVLTKGREARDECKAR